MSEIFPPPPGFSAKAHVNSIHDYKALYGMFTGAPERFWESVAAHRIKWMQPWSSVLEWNFETAEIKWFEGATLNASYNCLDRHIEAGRGDRIAIIWEGDDPDDTRTLTYSELLAEVCRWSNVIKDLGVQRGDRVCMYMPMVPEAAAAMLACARIGAVHSVVFAGFSADSLRDRILDAECRLLITADEGLRGGKTIPLKKIADEALEGVDCVKNVLVYERTGADVPMTEGRDLKVKELLAQVSDECEPEEMGAEDPLFILYTSGSTGTPKGVLHTTGGYMVYASYTHEMIFDWKSADIFWCTADIGWITGHTYIVYGPLCNGATTLMFEGVPSHPDWGRFWEVVDRHGVTIFYTAPTAIRAMAQHGDDYVTRSSRNTLRLLGTVGEPINPEAWLWYHRVVGGGRCPIVDTWWQTETGGILISPLPGATPLKPGSATLPFPGVHPVVVDDDGNVLEENPCEGNLCIELPWPGMARTIYGDHERFKEEYFTRFPGKYFTGDGCRRDEDGYYWITGRVDDVLNVSGHRLGTAELESALVAHESVAEAAVVAAPHEIKGQGIHAFVILNDGFDASEGLEQDLVQQVGNSVGRFAKPERVQIVPGLPKTRSGKIMRRILRKIAAGETDDLGDTTTLADPSVVEALISGR